MKVNLVPIGNSKGIRIPQSIIKQCGFGDQVDLSIAEGTIVLAPVRDARADWDAAFERMAAAGDDVLLLPDSMRHEWDEEEWEW